MGYPAKLLAQDETIKYEMHPHWRALIGPIIVLLINVFVGSLLVVIAPWSWLQWAIAAVMVFFLFWPTLFMFLRWITTQYVFTDRRVIVRQGILIKRGRDVPLSKINNVSFFVPFLGRILNYGMLDIQSAGENDGLSIKDVPSVESIQRDVYQLMESDDSRRRGGGPMPATDGT